MRYLIIEDEPLAVERLHLRMQEQKPHWTYLGALGSVAEALEKLPSLPLDLILVDIHLSDGLSFQIFEELDIEVPLIFTTAYDQYALKAFELNSIDYLLKPVHNEDLQRALHKLENRGWSGPPDWGKLVRELKPHYKERFMVSTGERIKTVTTADIAFFYASGKHSFITTRQGQEYLLDMPLRELDRKLDPQRFFQINRQFIVQVDAIVEMIPYSKSRLKLLTSPPTPEDAIVSVERSPHFKAWLNGED